MSAQRDAVFFGNGATIRREWMPQDNFTIVSNALARDGRLSFKARGIWLELASHRDGWRTSIELMAARSKDGKAAIRTGMQELIDCGYLRREQTRNADGTHGPTQYVVTVPEELRHVA